MQQLESDKSRIDRSGTLVTAAVSVCLAVLWFWFTVLPSALSDSASGYPAVVGWDLYTFFFPKYVYGNQELMAGRLPLWNPYEFGGIPFFASAQPAVSYPIKIAVFSIANEAAAMQGYLLVHFLLMPIFFAIFCKEQSFGWFGIFAGATYWTFNLELLPTIYHPDRISNLVWLPLIFLFGDRLAKRPTISAFALLALVFAVQITAGNPEFPMQAGVLLRVDMRSSLCTVQLPSCWINGQV